MGAIKNVGIITYDAPHLKTEQLLYWMENSGVLRRYDIRIFALPFVARPPREVLFAHRPAMTLGAHPGEVAASLGLAFQKVAGPQEIPLDLDILVIAGAGILPAQLVEHVPTLNCHPGLVPAVRGLDSFKWAILDRQPVGITLHIVDAEVDAGRVIHQVRTPLFPSDTLESFARRHYELEIAILADGLRLYEEGGAMLNGLSNRPPRKRMPRDREEMMISSFEDYKNEVLNGMMV